MVTDSKYMGEIKSVIGSPPQRSRPPALNVSGIHHPSIQLAFSSSTLAFSSPAQARLADSQCPARDARLPRPKLQFAALSSYYQTLSSVILSGVVTGQFFKSVFSRGICGLHASRKTSGLKF